MFINFDKIQYESNSTVVSLLITQMASLYRYVFNFQSIIPLVALCFYIQQQSTMCLKPVASVYESHLRYNTDEGLRTWSHKETYFQTNVAVCQLNCVNLDKFIIPSNFNFISSIGNKINN